MDLSIILPSYKEADNLRIILPKIKDTLDGQDLKYEILIIDTMEAMDDTREVCSEYGARYINRENGNMYGDAVRTGFRYAEGTYALIMDADGSHDPADIIRLYDEMKANGHDMVIGSRYCREGNTDNSFILKMMSWMLNVTYRVFFGLLRVKDVSNSFRIYRTEDVKKLELECENFDIVEELLIKLNDSKKDYDIREIPIHFSKRAKGESKRDLLKFIFSYLQTMARLKKIQKKK